MTFLTYAKRLKEEDSAIGDLVRDILRDDKFPAKGTNKEMIAYLKMIAAGSAADQAIQDLLTEYETYKSLHK